MSRPRPSGRQPPPDPRKEIVKGHLSQLAQVIPRALGRLRVHAYELYFRIVGHRDKPEATKEKHAHVQLTIYALALARRTGLKLKDFKCAWFDEKDYFEFFPLTGVYAERYAAMTATGCSQTLSSFSSRV